MLTYDPALQETLAATSSKKAWCDALIAALGPTRILICKRDENANAPDAFNSGTTFFRSSLVGTATSAGGNIVNLGSTKNATIQAEANLVSGTSVLRIEGNGHWIQGTFGLTTSNADFRVKKSPNGKSGIAFSNISISPPRLLPSGTGDPAPVLDPANTAEKFPAILELYTWVNPSNPTIVGTLNLDQRDDDLVFEDAELAAEMGDVRVTMCSNTIIYDGFEFGAIMMSIKASLNEEANVPLHQVGVSFKPHGSWPTYPFVDTMRYDRDRTVPKPFKMLLRAQDGTVLHIFEMRDGKPINDRSLSQRFADGFEAYRPFVDCGMMLVYQSHLPKPSSNIVKYFSGVTPGSLRHSMCKDGPASGAVVLANRGTMQINAALHYYAAPEWPIKFYLDQSHPDLLAQNSPTDDPYLYDFRTYHGGEGVLCNISGWRYEPGAICLHDRYPGPGGPRSDRSPTPTPLMQFVSDPISRRLKGDVPYRTLCDNWGKGYFNHSHHWLTDVKTFAGLPKDLVLEGKIAFGLTGYYGQNYTYVPGAYTRHIDVRAAKASGGLPPPTRDGTVWFAGWSLDHMHNYCEPGLWVLAFNSPLHLISARLRYAASICSWLGGATPGRNPQSYFLAREFAWRYLHNVVQWKIATKHKQGYSRADIEDVLVRELEAVYDHVYKPCKIDLVDNDYFNGIRRFGMPGAQTHSGDGQYKFMGPHSDTKTYYMAHVLVMMRQFGLFKVLREKSEKCATALDFMIECLDRYSIDMFHVTEGRNNTYNKYSLTHDRNDSVVPVMATSWEDWNANIYPKNGLEDYAHLPDGTVSATVAPVHERGSMHLRVQWVFARRDYFPEYPHPHLESVCTMVQGFYDAVAAKVEAEPVVNYKRGSDWGTLYPPHGILKAPTTLEPI